MFEILDPGNEVPERTKLHALNILSNLSLKDSLRQTISQNDGLVVFLAIVKREVYRFDSVDAERYAAKGIVNLVTSKRELRLKVVTELSEQIKLIYRGELDEIVATYL